MLVKTLDRLWSDALLAEAKARVSYMSAFQSGNAGPEKKRKLFEIWMRAIGVSGAAQRDWSRAMSDELPE